MGGLPVSMTTLPLNLIELESFSGEPRVPDNLEEHFGTLVSRWPHTSSVRQAVGAKENDGLLRVRETRCGRR